MNRLKIAKILGIILVVILLLVGFAEPSMISFQKFLPFLVFALCLGIAWFKPKIGGLFFIAADIILTIITWNPITPGFKTIFFLTMGPVYILPIAIGLLFYFSKK